MAFVSVKVVLNRIALTHKRMNLDIHDIAEYCFEMVKMYGIYQGFERFSLDLPVENGQVTMPCNLYSVESVRGNSSSCSDAIAYTSGTGCLRLPLTNCPARVVVSGLSYKVDEDGHPMIPDVLVTTCYWYCMTNLLLDPTYAGNAPGDILKDARQQFADALKTAKGSLQDISQDQMDDISRMLRSFFVTRAPN